MRATLASTTLSIALLGCRAGVDPAVMEECDDYAAAFERCQNATVGHRAGTHQAEALKRFYRVRAADAGADDQQAMRDTCSRAHQQLARRCSDPREARR